MRKIRFLKHNRNIRLLKREVIKNLLDQIFKIHGKQLENLSFIFCSDNYVKKINKEFLKHDYYTDVITFSLSEAGCSIQGEIYLSVDRIKENAKVYKVLYQNELVRVLIHGCLHLCGYRDDTRANKLQMTKQENFFLDRYEEISRET